MPELSQKKILATAALFMTLASLALAQDNREILDLSMGENLSAVSQIDGILIAPRWSPVLDLQYRFDKFFIDSENGIGIVLHHDEPVHFGSMLDYQYGRHSAADSRYRGMGDVGGSIAPAVFVEWEPIRDALDIYLNASKAVAGSSGWLSKLEITGGLPLAPNQNIYIDITANAGDSRYAHAYYGVNPAQALTSGYLAYSPHGGLLDLTTALGYEYRYSSNLSLNAQVGLLRYLDGAAESPLVERTTAFTTGIFATYQY